VGDPLTGMQGVLTGVPTIFSMQHEHGNGGSHHPMTHEL
jgi:hypothetical protein